jgi:hypothetical protein
MAKIQNCHLQIDIVPSQRVEKTPHAEEPVNNEAKRERIP